MKKRMKKIASLFLAATMVLSLAACGSSEKESGGDESAQEESGSESTEEGKVLNIWCWNDEFQSRFNDYYPEVKEIADDKSTTTLNDGTVVKWTINPNENNNYQNKLDEALLNQESADADDKIDIFLIEADYALKYVDSEYTVDVVNDIGLTEDDMADQYQYTKDIVTDSNGAIKGTTWQATPGLFAYRRSIAKDVLGTDDPDEVQAALSDWDKFNAVAEQASAKGYKMLSGYDDSYRTFSNNVSAPWVDGTKVVVDANLMNWVDQTKEFTDKGYNNKTSLWDDGWAADQGPDGDVFGFFYSTWGINFTLLGNSLADPDGEQAVGNGIYGDYAVCEGPEPYYWGGTWICAAAGTDNTATVKDVMEKLTCDSDIMKQITLDTQDYTNNKTAMNAIAEDPEFGSDFLGGQNHIALFAEAAEKIDMSNAGKYDQGCNEKFQAAFKDYFDGSVDIDTAKANFETAIMELYPNLTEVVWP
ncbi:MAG: carbohydrate ABC transporter substrate-binding protein [Dorea sp.]|nr:carbohydrate ABC transporter substrate-binding protein [Dorea sp.]MDY2814304.1 carbohydrate ABC transporter substrate-binding protein [Dorea sp.]